MSVNRLKFLLGLLLLAGCAQVATVKPTNPRLNVTGAQEPQLAPVINRLSEAQKLERTDPKQALGDYLGSAQTALDQLARDAKDKQTRDVYNFSVARSIGLIEKTKLNVWEHSLTVPAANGSYQLTAVRSQNPDLDPARYEIIPADTLILGGKFIQKRIRTEGIGAPVVAIGREAKVNYRQVFAPPRLYGSATGTIRFQGRQAQLQFFPPLATENVSLNGHIYPLAADFTAPIAVGLIRERPEKIALARMLRPEKYESTARLTRLQIYDPNRIPVVFVHGLQDTPVCWTPMINALREDPDIRRRYQLWVYSYPSGYPYPYSAALFRQELDSLKLAFPDHKDIVLVGHSMGGMISRLMITDAGDKLWRNYFGTAPAETKIPADSRKLLEQTLIFNHRPEVSRVIFVCAPHRGSLMATNWIGRIGTSLIRMPFFVASIPFEAINAAIATQSNSTATPIKRFPTSIDTLSPTNRFVVEVNKLPTTPGIPFHSIVGDRGRGDSPNSSDGVVDYWSSHLDGAQSELVVPANHSGALSDPRAIAEVERILHLHH